MIPQGFSGLQVVGLTKSYGAENAVDDVSLNIVKGELVCFLGPSGCGKTSLMRMIAGLEMPTKGRILLDGKDITDTAAHHRNFGMVFQSLALFPHLTVAQNIAYSLKLRGMAKPAIDAKILELLELIHLPGLGRRRVDQLSGGQRQRVAIARALAQEPRIFLMDEPLSALDARLREHMQLEIRQLQQRLGITTVFVTHDQREAMTIADRIVVMNLGKVQQIGTPSEIYRQPANRFVANFVGQSNLLSGEVISGQRMRIGEAEIEVDSLNSQMVGQFVSVCIRPEDVLVAELDSGLGMAGEVMDVRDMGATLEATIRCAGQDILVSSDRAQWDCVATARHVSVSLRAHCARLISQ